jgi:ABC-type phosphate/phosphonate transport system substrate-binding protein
MTTVRETRGFEWVAGLPMYDFPHLRAAHDALWTAVADRLAERGVAGVPRHLTRDRGHLDLLRDPLLLFGQTCEYPLATSYADVTTLVGTPCYTAPGCAGSLYCSVVIVRAEDPVEELIGLRNRRCVINEWDSNSGMNLLRAVIAAVSDGTAFFKSVVRSGSHLASVEQVARGYADVAAVDCVSFAHLQRACPTDIAKLRVLCRTPGSPSLPFITARASGDLTIRALRSVLTDVLSDASLATVREQLLLGGIDFEPDVGFTAVRHLEHQAVVSGYPILC